MAIEGIERSANRTWPAAERLDGARWSLQASGGWTRRSNSATVYGPIASGDVSHTLSLWERWYAQRSLPTMVRTTPLTPPALIAELDRRGYTHADGALVMNRPLPPSASAEMPAPDRGDLLHRPLDDWWDVFASDHHHTIDRPALEQLWTSTGLPSIYPVRRDDGLPVAVGMAVRDHRRMGIFNLRTRAHHRGRGHASALLGSLLGWAVRNGCTSAYLQVTPDNGQARSLYHRMGFEVVYEYRYRVQRTGARHESA
jgi:GNAT superfamily N-acetyltransferase